MKAITLALVLSLAAALVSAQEVTVVLPNDLYAELTTIVSETNAIRAKSLVDINASRALQLDEMNRMRDTKAIPPTLTAKEAGLDPLTAKEAGLSPMTMSEALAILVEKALEPRLKAAALQRAEADSKASLVAVTAIKQRSGDCGAKATAVGLDPLKVCK